MPEPKRNELKVTLPSDREILMTRTFNAPRQLVFDAMTKPEHVVNWWGMRGTILSVCEMNVRPGGTWRYVLVIPSGAEVRFSGVYHEIEPPGRLVATECFEEPKFGSPKWLSTITLEERDGKTIMNSRILHESAAHRDGHIQSGMEGGAAQTFDRLEELLHKQQTGEDMRIAEPMERDLEITRVFNAPRELVFEAWTKPEHMLQWWGPKVFTNHSCEMDVRPGGKWQIVMRSPDGMDLPCRGVFHEVVPPARIVFTNNAFDQNDKPLIEGLTTVILDEFEGKTKLTLKTHAVGLVEFAPMMLRGMEPGWNQSLDRLAEHLNA
jgi:uncharacterized protein YndB with AHSA1/START domain